jgi:hypothetical protein
MKFLLGMKPLLMPKNGLTKNKFWRFKYGKRSRKGALFFIGFIKLILGCPEGRAIRCTLSPLVLGMRLKQIPAASLHAKKASMSTRKNQFITNSLR